MSNLRLNLFKDYQNMVLKCEPNFEQTKGIWEWIFKSEIQKNEKTHNLLLKYLIVACH